MVAGEAFIPRVDEALLSIEEGLQAVREASSRCEAQIDIGFLASSYDTFVGDVLNVFRQTFASTQLTPHPMDPGTMVDALRAGKIDIAFIGHICPELEKEFDVFRLWRIPLAVVVGAQHPLAQRGSVELSELEGLPLVSLDDERFPGRHALILHTLREAGVTPGESRQVDSPLTALAHVAATEAYALMPSEVVSIATRHVRFVPLRDSVPGVDFYALVRRDEARKAVLTLLNECKRIVEAKQ